VERERFKGQREMRRVDRFQPLHPAAARKLKIRLRLVRAGLVLQESAFFVPLNQRQLA
jgi:hypothetical protein